MKGKIRPNKAEIEFLTLAYNVFYNIFDQVFAEDFWDKDSYYRFSMVKDAFTIYTELLNYEPIKWTIKEIKERRPPMEGEIGSELFKFVRNIFSHFPFFRQWDDVWISKSLTNWYRDGLSIDRFLSIYSGHNEVKYRFWEEQKKKMTYLKISFPSEYVEDTKIYLKDILTETEGVKFSLILMKRVLDSQIVNE